MEWISVKDRLPETGGYYLCHEILSYHGKPEKSIKIVWYSILDKCWDGKDSIGIITHWMLLPEFPKEIII